MTKFVEVSSSFQSKKQKRFYREINNFQIKLRIDDQLFLQTVFLRFVEFWNFSYDFRITSFENSVSGLLHIKFERGRDFVFCHKRISGGDYGPVHVKGT